MPLKFSFDWGKKKEREMQLEIVVKIKATNEAARATVEKLRVEIRSKMLLTLDFLSMQFGVH